MKRESTEELRPEEWWQLPEPELSRFWAELDDPNSEAARVGGYYQAQASPALAVAP